MIISYMQKTFNWNEEQLLSYTLELNNLVKKAVMLVE